MKTIGKYDVIVVGAGHAGIEAAVAASKLGVNTAIFTLSLDAIGNLPCNPSIGGTAKGHLVREIDALGGCMGIAADKTMLQSRMLNMGKGAAVHSLRVQTDRAEYHLYTKELLEKTPYLDIKQAEIIDLIIDNRRVIGVKTKLGAVYEAKTVIIATGTYLGGRIFIGESNYSSGPDGIISATELSDNLRKLDIPLLRFKTGTPARVHRSSIDYSKLTKQPGDDVIIPFSFLTDEKLYNKKDCYIANTNLKTHQIIKDNLHKSPLYAGLIEGVGPRYCPSIEDKIVKFSDKDHHQIFVEPCGFQTEEMYLQGLSTSLPEEVQLELYRSIEGFENIHIMRPAYAIEYDCIDPLELAPTLECMRIEGLYGAGQFNGSSGYEEAAAQGLVAGINAARKVQNKEEIIFERQNSYIGTLIDDLVTKGVSDPYRMMTSRSEYRLYLRQDNADERLTPLGREIGLVDDYRWNRYISEQSIKKELNTYFNKTRLNNEKTNKIITKYGMEETNNSYTIAELLKRSQIHIEDLVDYMPENYNYKIAKNVEIEIKYEGYIKRQLDQINQVKKQENTKIPDELNYQNLSGLRLEAREKLSRIKPRSLGQAARIPGVSPSDISQLALAIALFNKELKGK